MLALRNNLLGNNFAFGGAAPPPPVTAVLSGIHTALYPGTVRASVPPATTYFEANGWGYTVSAVASPVLTVNWSMEPLIALPPHSLAIFTLAGLTAPVNHASRVRLTLATGSAGGGLYASVRSSASNAVDGFTGILAGETSDINSPGVATSANNGALTAAVGPFSVALVLRSSEDNVAAMTGTLEFI